MPPIIEGPLDAKGLKIALVASRFNEFVTAGTDPDFGRGDAPYDRAFSGGAPPLYRIDKPPFHAAAFGLSDLGTKGGLRTEPIPAHGHEQSLLLTLPPLAAVVLKKTSN